MSEGLPIGDPSSFYEAGAFAVDLEGMGDAYFEGDVLFAVANGETEAYRVIIVVDGFPDDLLHGCAVGAGRIPHLGKSADEEAGETGQFAAASQLTEHAVYIIKVLPHIFEEKEFTPGIDIRSAADEVGQQGKVAPYQRGVGLSVSVQAGWRATVGRGHPGQSGMK
jgi:hypothetical protein